jgi:hypothetical protein
MKIDDNLTELLILILLVVGFLLSLTAATIAINYIIITVCGLFFGRQFYVRKKERKMMFAFYLAIALFLVGYIIGAVGANTKLILLFFLIGVCFSYWVHSNLKWLAPHKYIKV